jgi:soluble lytic murein transglycosylase-like protein
MLQRIRIISIVLLPAMFVWLGARVQTDLKDVEVQKVQNWDRFEHSLEVHGDSPANDLLGLLEVLNAKLGPEYTQKDVRALAQHIFKLSRRYDFPPAFILSLIDVESGFNTHAVSHRGAVGLLQLRWDTAEDMARKLGLPWKGEETMRDPKLNLEMALRYLHDLRREFKQPKFYVTAYNHGPARMAQILRNREPLPDGYYKKVIRSYQNYHAGAY